MTELKRLWELTRALAHESASDPVDLLRHRLFIANKLVLCVAALSAAPLYLALAGAPSGLEALALAFAFAPFGSIFVACRSGNLALAAGIGAVGVIGFAAALAFAAPGLAPAAWAILILAPLEASFASSKRIVIASACIAGLVACLGAAATAAGGVSVASALLMCGALAYAASVVSASERVQALRHTLGDVGRARYESLAHVVGDVVLHIDRSGVVFQSLGGGDLLGLAARDVMGRGLFERIHVGDRPAFLKTVSDAASSDLTMSAQVRLRGEGASAASGFGWVDLRARRVDSPIAAKDGRGMDYVTAVLRDVTDLRDHAYQLEAAQRETVRMGQWQDRFLANVSHELRTPLNAIIGFSEILSSQTLAPADPAKRTEYAGIINQSGQHLLEVVNSILDMSKIEAGSFNLAPEPFDLTPLIDQCCDIVRLKAEETGVNVGRDVPVNIGELVADKRALKQILINLVSNAVKFTPPNGRVLIRVRPEGASLAIAISDTGIGILQADLGRLGDPFFQAGGSYDRPYEGTGLGLSVVRGLVGLHGGAITVESAPDEGTCVTVKLPLDCRLLPDGAKTALARIHTLARGPGRMTVASQDKVKKIA